MTLGRNSFAPWMRQGLANALVAPEPGKLRAGAEVKLVISGSGGANPVSDTVTRRVEVYGPHDTTFDEAQIVRTEPRHWVTDFEPNYLAFIEFYDEDYPWRYSPAVTDGDRLLPWLALIVLTEDEGSLRAADGRPYPFVEVTDPDTTLPDPNDAWAWAHVHTNETLTGADTASSNEGATSGALGSLLSRNRDLAYSRLLCPRNLLPKTRYHAFVVPLFESGRLKGLKLDIADTPSALHFAWRHDYPSGESRPEPQNLPVYRHWQFETSETGDFEYLVRLLKPRVADSRIGRRPIDVTEPSSNLSGIEGPFDQGVLRLGGALQVPFDTLSAAERTITTRFENWDTPYPTPFQTQLSAFLNLGDAYTRKTAADANADSTVAIPAEELDDPLVLPPIYGQWHARMARLLEDRDGNALPNDDNWVHETNLDPRHRATAAFGTKVIQKGQEGFMASAWQQVGDVVAANRRLRFGQLSLATNIVWHQLHLSAIAAEAPGQLVQTYAPMMRRLPAGALNAKAMLARSIVPPVAVSSAFRRASRPRGPLAKRVSVSHAPPAADIVSRIAAGEIVAAPPKVTPPALPTTADLPAAATTQSNPAWTFSFAMSAILLLLLLALLLLGLWLVAIPVALGFAYSVVALLRTARTSVGLAAEAPAASQVDAMPVGPDFHLADPFSATPSAEPALRPQGFGSDSPELRRYKLALKPLFAEQRATARLAAVRPAEPIDISAFAGELLEQSNPRKVIPAKLGALITVPDRIRQEQVEEFAPVMAYPVFDVPMYEHLLGLSDEHFVPNLQYVAQNSISLLETNQPFIEAYMLGLNHEFCRELLWREYPTDQRATCFRQFWDVSSYLDRSGKDETELREELRDIPPIHRWSLTSKLGDHDHRDRGGPAENELVLVIRGDLLKRYPTAVIYAQRAKWQTLPDGTIDNSLERQLVTLTPAQEDNPPEDILKTPIYEARAAPDIYFFGFDLTAAEARGDSGDNAGDDAGWFFVIKERPGEPRFGFDVDRGSTDTAVWSDLAWSDVSLETSSACVSPAQSHGLTEPAPTDERHEQWLEDRHVAWTATSSSAELGYILYQLPVMVAVHAAEMLPRPAP